MRGVLAPFPFLFLLASLSALPGWSPPVEDLAPLSTDNKTAPPPAAIPSTPPREQSPPPASEGLQGILSQLPQLDSVDRTDRLRLQSLIQEIMGRPDMAYLTYQQIQPDDTRDAWRDLRMLHLTDKLGLEEEKNLYSEKLEKRFLNSTVRVTELQLCTRIRGFGDYDVIEPAEWESGMAVLVYAEVAGLSFVREEQKNVYKYSTAMQVLSRDGRSLWLSPDRDPFRVQSRSTPSDFHIWYRWIPSQPPGQYQLLFQVQDLVGRSHHSKVLPITLR